MTVDLDRYDYALPPEQIAQHPLPERDGARLLVLERARDALHHAMIRDLPAWLAPGDLPVRNTTRVLPARLRGRKASGGAAEALLLGPGCAPDRYLALVRAGGRLRTGLKLCFAAGHAEITAIDEDGAVELAFEPGVDPYAQGETPVPPYIRRNVPDADDALRYQTVFARVPGAVAAPTAGLHLTGALLDQLTAGGVEIADVVLHVGPGSFRPLRERDLRRGRLHAEPFALPAVTADRIAETRGNGGRVVALGTTTARVLESCVAADGRVTPGLGQTDLFLRPGSRFQVVDALLTNFHLPRSSLLLLVSAFAGRDSVLAAYAEAVRAGYRFYSYGDAMLVL
ncbi:MAG: tRNA preQ1(34) S-adenosylmethionine ribosyltransferase-isomerase QueA [bacterium]|nr:tRNA preQ1(34) S-adenosylmethionine ribosyltransferase-isomerase QueA [bacterium]